MNYETPMFDVQLSENNNCVPFCNFKTFKRKLKAFFKVNGFTDYKFSETPINGAEYEEAFIYKHGKYRTKKEYSGKQKIYLIAKIQKKDLLRITREINLWSDITTETKQLSEEELRKTLISNSFSDEEIQKLI